MPGGLKRRLCPVTITTMKIVTHQHGATKKARTRRAHTRCRQAAPGPAASAQKTRDQWVHRLEAARQTALDINMRSMSPDDISREIRLRRGELP